MTKYRVDRILPARTRDRSRNGTALLCATRLIIDKAGDAGVRTVGADVLFECPRCLGRRDNGTYDWSAEERSVPSGKYAVDAAVSRAVPRRKGRLVPNVTYI